MFALPQGYPPDISAAFGILKSRTKLSIDDMRVLALIEAAGEEFYLRIAKSVRNPDAAALLTQNGREELGHAHRLLKAIVAAGGESFELPAPNENPFVAGFPAEFPATPEFIGSLESGEKDGDRIYQTWADAAANAEVAKVLRQNGREETRHGERDAQVIKLLEANV
jgi:hypothetical protein